MELATGLGFFMKGASHLPGMMGSFGIVAKIIIAFFAVFWLVMIVHCLRRKFDVDMDKVAWILVFVFLPVIGAFAYLFDRMHPIRRKKKK